MRLTRRAALVSFALASALAMPSLAQGEALPATAAALNLQPWMNVFRRYDADDEAMFAFYENAVGLERLPSFGDVGAGGVHRFRAGASELKLTRRVDDRSYVEGGVKDATGLRLITLYVADAEATAARFEAAGYPAPEFVPLPGSTRSAALVEDPDGQPLRLVAVPGEGDEALRQVEVGLTVSDLDASRAFYRDFVGLEELPPTKDSVLGATVHPYRHGTTTVSLMSFGADLPKDTGSGGIQYVVTDAAVVDGMAKARGVTIETPLSGLPGYRLRTVWLNDPDGITNYFAQVGAPAEAAGD